MLAALNGSIFQSSRLLLGCWIRYAFDGFEKTYTRYTKLDTDLRRLLFNHNALVIVRA